MMTIGELNRRARAHAEDLATLCGCRNASVHFGVARAQIEARESERLAKG